MHGRISDDGHFIDFLCRSPDLAGCFGDYSVETLDDLVMHLIQPFSGMIHGIADSGHDILPEGDLGVHQSIRSQDLPAIEVTQIAGYSGRADIDGETIEGFEACRSNVDNLLVHPDDDIYLPICSPEVIP